MTAAEFEKSIREDFLTHWEAGTWEPSIFSGDPLLSWDGKSFDTGSNDAKTNGFARLAVRHFAGDIAALGTRLHRRTGQIYVQVFEPADKGTEITAALAEYAVEFLEKGRRLRQAHDPWDSRRWTRRAWMVSAPSECQFQL